MIHSNALGITGKKTQNFIELTDVESQPVLNITLWHSLEELKVKVILIGCQTQIEIIGWSI